MKKLVYTLAAAGMVLAGAMAASGEQTNYDIGKVAGSELKVGLGPRAAAVGEAFAGKADDWNALAWNPAGLSQISGIQAGFMHNLYLQETALEYLAYAQKLFTGAGWGANVAYFNYGTMEKLNEVNGRPEAAGEFTPAVLTAALGYGQQLLPALAVGGAVKVIHQRIDTQNDTAVAADAGLLVQPGLDGLQIGAVLQHAGTPLAGAPLPLNLKAGAAYRLPFTLAVHDAWSVLLDANLPFGDAAYASVHLGTEYWYNRLVAGRVGYKFKDQGGLGGATGLTAGVGFRAAMLNIDYALVSFGELGLTHQIAVSVGWE